MFEGHPVEDMPCPRADEPACKVVGLWLRRVGKVPAWIVFLLILFPIAGPNPGGTGADRTGKGRPERQLSRFVKEIRQLLTPHIREIED